MSLYRLVDPQSDHVHKNANINFLSLAESIKIYTEIGTVIQVVVFFFFSVDTLFVTIILGLKRETLNKIY